MLIGVLVSFFIVEVVMFLGVFVVPTLIMLIGVLVSFFIVEVVMFLGVFVILTLIIFFGDLFSKPSHRRLKIALGVVSESVCANNTFLPIT